MRFPHLLKPPVESSALVNHLFPFVSFKECTNFERESFTCIPGFFGGAESERPFEFSCQATWPDASDWAPVLCVRTNNSPFIGYLFNFTSPPTAQNSNTFNKLAGKKKTFTYSEEERVASVSGKPYVAGATIKTAANPKDAKYTGAVLGFLSLPRSVVSGLCSPTIPVRFTENFQSQCVLPLDESLCGSSTSLSAYSYLMSQKLIPPPAIFPAAVLRDGMLSVSQSVPPNLADTEVRYFCTADSSSSVAMTPEEGMPAANSGATDSSLFHTGDKTAPPRRRCGFDDGLSAPPAPVFNETTRTCSNVVLNVEYELTWRGTQLLGVKAGVVLGDVVFSKTEISHGTLLATSQSPVRTLTQRFSVVFVHSPLAQNGSNSSVQPPFTRSGNPGYIRGLSVLARKVDEQSGKVSWYLIIVPDLNLL